jgi:serine/threonine-protein kinase
MAPEMVVEGLLVDRRTDVFSCGIVLSELLAGRALWQNLTALQILRRLADNDVPQIATIEAGIPPALAAICERALHPDPASRHATAAELRQEIEAFLRAHSDPPTAECLAAIVVDNYDEQRQRRARVIRERMERTGRPPVGGIEELIPVIWTPGSISNRPAAPRRSWIPYGLVGAAGIGLAVIAYAVGAGGSVPTDPPAPKADTAPAEAPPAATAAVAPVVDAQPDPGPTPVVDVVELRAAASPPTATLYLDGEPLDGNPAVVSIPRNGVVRRIEARAEGYETHDAEVVPDLDREVVLKLTRSKAGKARPRKPKPPDGRSDKLDIERESPW